MSESDPPGAVIASAPTHEAEATAAVQQAATVQVDSLDAPDILRLLTQLASRMGSGVSQPDALRRSLRTMLALYDAKANGGQPVVRFGRTEQQVNLPGAS